MKPQGTGPTEIIGAAAKLFAVDYEAPLVIELAREICKSRPQAMIVAGRYVGLAPAFMHMVAQAIDQALDVVPWAHLVPAVREGLRQFDFDSQNHSESQSAKAGFAEYIRMRLTGQLNLDTREKMALAGWVEAKLRWRPDIGAKLACIEAMFTECSKGGQPSDVVRDSSTAVGLNSAIRQSTHSQDYPAQLNSDDAVRLIQSQQGRLVAPTIESEQESNRIASLAERVQLEAKDLVRPDEWFAYYLNPYEALQLEKGGANGEIDAKLILRAKKLLLNEIKLEGRVRWLNGYALDASRVHTLDNELLDPVKAHSHWVLFQNKPLLHFLTRGDVSCFLYSPASSRLDTHSLPVNEPSFVAFVSKPFAQQFNVVMTRAIERRLLSVVESLSACARWVMPADDELCFDGATRRVTDLVEAIRSKATDESEGKLGPQEVEVFVQENSIPDLFNRLPLAFATFHKEVIHILWESAVESWTKYGDRALAKRLLLLCKRFNHRGYAVTQMLNENLRIIDQIIAEESKYPPRPAPSADVVLQISEEGVRYGSKFFPTASIQDLRWGMSVTGGPGSEQYHYIFVARDNRGDTIISSCGTDKSGEVEHLTRFVEQAKAARKHLVRIVVEKLHRRILSGQEIGIGGCRLLRQGIVLVQTCTAVKDIFLAWRDVVIETRKGLVLVSSKANRTIVVAISMSDTDNAVLLPDLAGLMTEGCHDQETTDCDPRTAESKSNGSVEQGTFRKTSQYVRPATREAVRNSQSSKTSAWREIVEWWPLVIIAIIVVIGVVAAQRYPTIAATSENHLPPRQANLSNSRQTSPTNVGLVPEADPKLEALLELGEDLEKASERIEQEKRTLQQLARDLGNLAKDIDQKRFLVTRTNRAAVDEFNGLVNTHNQLLEQVRTQQRRVSLMVEMFNKRLQEQRR